MGEENNFGYILAFQSCVDFNVKELDDEKKKRKSAKQPMYFMKKCFIRKYARHQLKLNC